MDWNSAVKTALHNARMKQKIAYARNEMFWLVNADEPSYDTYANIEYLHKYHNCLLYTSPSPRD